MAISIRNLDAALGAEVSGIDVSKLVTQDDVKAIEDVWNERLVVVFHGQKLSDPQLIAFSKRFGELDPPGPNPYGEPFLKEHPELNVISNVVEDGKPIGNLGDGEAVWHADMTYVDVPPKAAMLHSLEIPPIGGNTYFANMFAAYESLPTDLKTAVAGKIAVHDASTNSRCARRGRGASSPGPHRTEDRAQGAFPRASAEQLCARLGCLRERSLARCTLDACDAIALCHVS